MSRASAVCLTVLLTAGCGGGAPSSPSTNPVPVASPLVQAYLNEMIGLMQTSSINRARIDWTDFRAQVMQKAQGAQTLPDAYPAISVALGLLDDHHSFYSSANGVGVGNPTAKRCTAPVVPSPAVPSDIGYVRIGSFSSTVAGADRAFADAVQQQIRTADAATVIGWVVDLAATVGATCGPWWPRRARAGRRRRGLLSCRRPGARRRGATWAADRSAV